MTEKLKQLLHEQASAPQFDPLDVAALVADGDRRIRHRRAALAGAAAALAVVGGLLLPPLLGGESRGISPTDPGGDGASVVPSVSPSYAKGDTIYFEGGSIDVGHEVAAYVRTSIGYVFADPEGRVWSVTSAEVNPVGVTDPDHPRLVADDESVLAGWVDNHRAKPTFVVLSQDSLTTTHSSQGTHRGMPAADGEDAAYFIGIDDGVAYWRDDRGLVASTEEDTTVLDPSMGEGARVLDVEDGLFAFDAGDDGTAIGTAPDEVVRTLPGVYGSAGRFSTEGSYYSSDADEPLIFESRTGEQVDLDLDAGFATAYEWLDDSTAVVIAADRAADDAEASLWTCRVPSGECELFVDDLGTFDQLSRGSFALPSGEPLGD